MKATLEKRGWEVGKVEVLAVGLFETVSSHGAVYWNDVSDLKLDSISQAAAVLQIAAAEEYRKNFSLTNIHSAAGNGRQIYLPGAHSDIGGGYVGGAGESQVLVSGSLSKDIARFMLDRGWYRVAPGQEELDLVVTPTGNGNFEYVSVTRKSIAGQYTFIPLRIMADFVKEKGVPVAAKLKTKYNPGPVPGRDRIESYAGSVGGVSSSKPEDWDGTDPVLAELRNRHLHVSFRAQLGMSGRFHNAGSFWRPQYRPYRKVYDG